MTFGHIVYNDLTLSDGTAIPAGVLIDVHVPTIHSEPAPYPDAECGVTFSSC